MKNHVRSESGFAHVLLVVILVAALGVAAFFAYRTRTANHSTSATPTPTVSTGTTPTPTPDPTAGWKSHTSTEGRFSLKYPSNWVTADCNGDGLVNLFIATVKSHLAVCQSDSPGEMDVISLAGDRLAEYKGHDTGWKETVVDGTKAFVVRDINRSFMSPEYKLAVYKEYLITKNGRTFVLIYMQDTHRGFPDSEEQFTTMVEKTFKVQ